MLGGGVPLAVDALVRISSDTKPMVAALALALSLADAGLPSLDDPVELFVPQLAGRRHVLRRLDASLETTRCRRSDRSPSRTC